MFNRQKFMEHYGIKIWDMLQVLAALMGNDYISPQEFEKIFTNIKLPRKSKDMSERHRKIKGLLLYLAKEKCAMTALNQLLGFFQGKERERLKEKVLMSMKIYNGLGNCDIISQDFTTYEGRSFPAWFITEYHSCLLINWFVGIAANRRYFLTSQVEMRNYPSVHLSALPLHQAMVDILTSPDLQRDQVRLYARVGNTMKVAQCLVPGVQYTSLEQVRERSVEDRRDMVRAVLSPGVEGEVWDNIPERLKLFTLILESWSRQTEVTVASLTAVLMCYFVMTKVDPITKAERSTKKLQMLAEREKDDTDYFRTAAKLSP